MSEKYVCVICGNKRPESSRVCDGGSAGIAQTDWCSKCFNEYEESGQDPKDAAYVDSCMDRFNRGDEAALRELEAWTEKRCVPTYGPMPKYMYPIEKWEENGYGKPHKNWVAYALKVYTGMLPRDRKAVTKFAKEYGLI